MGGPRDLIRGLNIPHSEETLAPTAPSAPAPLTPEHRAQRSAHFLGASRALRPTNSAKFVLLLPPGASTSGTLYSPSVSALRKTTAPATNSCFRCGSSASSF